MAISFDTSLRQSVAGNTLSYTPGALTNGCICVVWYSATTGADTLSSISYGASAMTIVQQVTTSVTNIALCILANPPTGAQTITAVPNIGTSVIIVSSFNGVDQTNPVDSSASLALGATTSSPQLLTTTVVNANCWLVGGTNETSSNTVAGIGTTRRQLDLFDSNGTVGTGSQSLQVTFSGTQAMAWVVASLKPAGAAAASFPFKTLLGVGK